MVELLKKTGRTTNRKSICSVSSSRKVRIQLVPEGEWGWVVCAAAFVVQFLIMGVHNSFGILYAKLLEEFNKSKAETGT